MLMIGPTLNVLYSEMKGNHSNQLYLMKKNYLCFNDICVISRYMSATSISKLLIK